MTVSIAAALTAWLITDDWLIAASVLVLGLIWWALRAEEGPPVLALAMSLQWVQVTIGLFYVYLTGRTLEATLMSDYRPMVMIGLGCVVALVIGLWGGTRLIDRLGQLARRGGSFDQDAHHSHPGRMGEGRGQLRADEVDSGCRRLRLRRLIGRRSGRGATRVRRW